MKISENSREQEKTILSGKETLAEKLKKLVANLKSYFHKEEIGVASQTREETLGPEEKAQLEREELLTKNLDRSYSESIETKNGEVSVAWMDEAGSDGGYVITFPNPKKDRVLLEDYLPTEFDENGGIAEGGLGTDRNNPRVVVGVRRDVAKTFFDEAVKVANEDEYSVRDAQRDIIDMRKRYGKQYIWNKDPEVSFPKHLYHDEREVAGITMGVVWVRPDGFELYFDNLNDENIKSEAEQVGIYDSYFRIGDDLELAKRAIEFAEAEAERTKGDVIAVYKATKEQIGEWEQAKEEEEDFELTDDLKNAFENERSIHHGEYGEGAKHVETVIDNKRYIVTYGDHDEEFQVTIEDLNGNFINFIPASEVTEKDDVFFEQLFSQDISDNLRKLLKESPIVSYNEHTGRKEVSVVIGDRKYSYFRDNAEYADWAVRIDDNEGNTVDTWDIREKSDCDFLETLFTELVEKEEE